MNKYLRVCATEKEIVERLDTFHPEIVTYGKKGSGADYLLTFYNLTEASSESLDYTFRDVSYGDGTRSLAEELVALLNEKNLTIATAESLTGGSVGSKIVDVAGCSSVYYGGVIAYSNELKISALGVAEETIADFGAVSEQTAIEMATGLLNENVNLGISTTGIAGPTGGSLLKPVGLVYIAVTDEENTDVFQLQFAGNREEIRNQARDKALFYAIKHLQLYY